MITGEERKFIDAIRKSKNPEKALEVIAGMLSDADSGMTIEAVEHKWVTSENKKLFS